MNVLVTGSTGFIGKYLIKELIDHKYSVSVLSRRKTTEKNIIGFQGDITKKETIIDAFEGVDAVFHNAAYAMDWGDKKEIKNINIEGTRNVGDVCIKKNISRVIFTSTAGVYGFPNTKEILTENSFLNPFNIYHKSKLESEKVLKTYNNLKISIIRPVLVLGAGGKASHIIIKRIKDRKMRFIGNGNQNISVVHPADVAQCLRLALEKDMDNSIYNVVSFYCPVKELLNKIARQMNVNPPGKHVSYSLAYFGAFLTEKISRKNPQITRFRIKSFGTNRMISNKKAKMKLGFSPKYNLQKMVKDMVSDFNYN